MAEDLKEIKRAIKEQTEAQRKLQKEKERLEGSSTGGTSATKMAAAGKSSGYISEIIKQRKETNAKLRDVGAKLKDLENKQQVAKDTAPGMMDAMSEAFRDGLSRFLGVDFKETFLGALTGIKDGLVKLGKKMSDGFKKLYTNLIKKPVSSLLDIIMNAIKTAGLVIGFIEFLKGWEKATKWFGENADFGDRLAAGLANVAGAFLGLDDNQRKIMAEKIATFFDKIGEIFNDLFEGVKTTVMGLYSGDSSMVKDGLKSIFDTIVDTLLGGIKTLLMNFTDNEARVDEILGNFKAVFDKLFEAGEALFKLASDLAGLIFGDSNSSWGQVWESFSNLGAKMLSLLDEGLNAVLTMVGLDGAYQSLKDGIMSVVDTLVYAVESIMAVPKMLHNAFKGVMKFLYDKTGMEIFNLTKNKQVDTVGYTGSAAEAAGRAMSNISSNEMLSQEEKDSLSSQIDSVMSSNLSDYEKKGAINKLIREHNKGLSKLEKGGSVTVSTGANTYDSYLSALNENTDLTEAEKQQMRQDAIDARASGQGYNAFTSQQMINNNNLAIQLKPQPSSTVIDDSLNDAAA